MDRDASNTNAAYRWNHRAVGGQRSQATPGSEKYFQEIKSYRYGYETPFIKRLLLDDLHERAVLEIGVGNGIDAVEILKAGARFYTGLDITENHLRLTQKNLTLNRLNNFELVESDLLDIEQNKEFDVIYSFGVLHHIHHEKKYLQRMRECLSERGELRVALYSKYSFFNAYLFITWLFQCRMQVSFNVWQGHVSDGAKIDRPITIKIRSKSEILALYQACGFKLTRYQKRGFVQGYIPVFGKFLEPDGFFLNLLGSVLGWYHIMIFEAS